MKMGIKTIIKQSDGATGRSRFKTPRPVLPDPGGTRDRDTDNWNSLAGTRRMPSVLLAAGVALLAAAIFIGDLMVPLGVAGGVPYVAVILVGWWFPKRRYIFFLAAITSVLTFAGYVWSPDGGIPWVVVANRLLALFAIWVTAFLLIAAKTATAKMRESGARLAGAIESLQEGFVLYDADDRMVMINDVYRGINPQAQEILEKGMRFEDLIRANVESGRIVEAVGREEEFIRERLEQHRNPGPPILRQFNDGRWYVIKETRTPKGGNALTFSDVTDLKESERALSETEAIRKSEERLRMIFETSPIGVSIFSPETNRRLYMNTAMVKLFGAETEEQLLEQNIKKTWANLSDLDRLRSTDPDDFTEEMEIERLRLDGTKWWCHMHRRRIEFEGQNAIMNWHYDITKRKEAEEASRESEARLRAILDTVPAMVNVKDTAGRYLLSNRAHREFFGFEGDEVLGKTSTIISRKHGHRVRKLDRSILESGEGMSLYDFKALDAEGCKRDLLTTKAPLKNLADEIVGIVTANVDITERKRAEEEINRLNEELEQRIEERTKELQESEALFRAVVNHSPTKIHIKDTDGRYTLINKEAEKLFGVTDEEGRGKTSHDLFEKDVADAFVEHDRAVIESGEAVEEEEEFTLDDGVHTYLTIKFPIFDLDGMTGIGAIGTDITDLKKADRALRESEEKFKDFAEAASDWFWEMDANLRFSYFSDHFEKITGVTQATLLGKTREETGIPDVDPDAWAKHLADLKAHRGFDNFVHPRTHQNGQVVWLSISGKPVFDENGVFRGYRGTGTDITDLKKADRALVDSEERLRRSVLDAPIPIIMHAEDGEVLMISNRWTELSGYSHSDIPTIHDWTEKAYGIDKKCMKRQRKMISDLYEIKEPGQHDAYVTTASGEQRIWEVHNAPLGRLPDGRRFVISMALDITERKKAEEALRQKTKLVELLHRVTVSANKAKSVNAAMKTCFKEVCAYMGWPMGHLFILAPDSTETLVPTNVWHLKGTRRFDAFRKATAKITFETGEGLPGRVLASGRPEWLADLSDARIFLRARVAAKSGIKSGFALPVVIGREVVAVLEFFSTERIEPDELLLQALVDIGTQLGRVMERKRAETTLRESEERFRRAIIDAPIPIMIHADDGEVLMISNRWTELSGYTHAEIPTIAGWTEKAYGKGGIIEESRERIGALYDIEEQEGEGEYYITTKSGEPKTWNFRSSPLGKLPDGRSLVISMAVDITEQKATEERLRQAQKMEAMGQLTGGIAHDFNNLLGIIIGHLELVQSVGIKDNDMREDLKEAQKAALRGAHLTRQLLDFSRHKPRGSCLVNINQVIESIKELLAKSLTSKIDVVLHLADGLWTTELDVSGLENAILNMSINAHDAMSKGGVLMINTENETLNRGDAASIPELSPGEYVVLSVSDTGAGMSQETVDQVFEPFFTTKEQGKGTGLGLSTVYGFVKRSGGYIAVDSELGRGTTFRIYLPKSSLKSENLASAKKSETEMPGGMETILIVDDETQLLKSTKKILKSLGYTVYCAKDAHQALKTLKNKGDIDLLFSDVVMPGKMNGFELARNAREKKPDLKVLITSGFEQNAFKKAPYFGFSKNLLPKPYRMIELATRIRAALDAGE